MHRRRTAAASATRAVNCRSRGLADAAATAAAISAATDNHAARIGDRAWAAYWRAMAGELLIDSMYGFAPTCLS